MNRTARLAPLAVLLVVLLGACSSGAAAPTVPPVPSAAPSAPAESPSASDPGTAGSPAAGGPSGAISSPEAAAAAVLATDPRFAGLEAKNPELIGQCCFYEVQQAPNGWKVSIEIGWGDCPAGCIDRHNWTFTVTPTGTVTKVSESGPPVPSGTPAGG
jgi:hypothetical protein